LFDLDFPRAFPPLKLSATFRREPEDFFVDEQLGFDLSGVGEHLCLRIEKKNQNTIFVAKQLAQWAGVRQMDVGYCGLKDRHAVTRQWFSLYVGKNEPPLTDLVLEDCSVLAVTRHNTKLRPGMHAGNAFVIRLRDVQGESTGGHSAIDILQQRWQTVVAEGVPNYFGEQRFGRQGNNLQQATALLDVHAKQWRERKNQFAVSALRAYLFNHVLADRVKAGDWRCSIVGDPQAIATAPLWGRGRSVSSGELALREQHLLAPYAAYCEKLEHVGLQQERRVLLLSLRDTAWVREGSDAVVSFTLPPGTYATSVLRECLQLQSAY
jgi:tRNA pseudouridine13 synthase